MMRSDAIRGASIIIKKCLGLHPHDVFLLVFDETTRHFPPLFKAAAQDSEVSYRQVFISRRLQEAGRQAFSSEFLDLLKTSRGILLATTDDERCSKFRIVLTSDLRDAGNALATMPGASVEILATAIDVDYNNIIRMCRDLTIPLIKGKHCTVTTVDRHNKPYTLHFELGGFQRTPIQSYGLVPLQAWGNVPAGETFVAPLEETANGQYLVNGAIGDEKVIGSGEALIEFVNGKLVKHFYLKDGSPVKHISRLQETASRHQHGHCWSTIAEFGIGVNKNIRRTVGVQLIDEKRYGTIHIAVGHNAGYGGNNPCHSVHCDMTTVKPTVDIDGRRLIDCGEHVYRLEDFLDDYRSGVALPEYEWKKSYTHVKLNEDSYEIDNGSRLLVKHITQSGRQTIYAVGNDPTSHAARELVRRFTISDVLPIDSLQRQLSMATDDFMCLLSILFANGVVSP